MTVAIPQEPHTVPPGNARDIVTPDAFRVDPALLGLPLARPWRRGLAMALDGVVIAILSGGPSVLFGVALAALVLRISAKPTPGGGYIRRSVRTALRSFGALIAFAIAIVLWGSVAGWLSSDDDSDDAEADRVAAIEDATGGRVVGVGGMSGVRAGTGVLRIARADNPLEARTALEDVVPQLRAAGMSDVEIREAVTGFSEIPGREWLAPLIDSIVPAPAPVTAALPAAATAADSTLAATRDSLALVQAELADEQARARRLAGRLERLEERSESSPIMGFLTGIANDLGLGFGWAGVYFTAFFTLWKGRTPGKWVMGIRVIQLNGQPLGWWAAFGRFGGYAAGIATGLLGFAQIFWDRNRQAVHDKISETVVIRDARA